MGETPQTLLGVLSRAVHIASVVVLVGGIFYARFFSSGLAARFRNWVYAAILVLVASGLYNLLAKASYPPGYHAWFGVKMLLVLHIFAASLVASLRAAGDNRLARTLTGILVSAAAVILISAWLRWISLG